MSNDYWVIGEKYIDTDTGNVWTASSIEENMVYSSDANPPYEHWAMAVINSPRYRQQHVRVNEDVSNIPEDWS